jgi:transcriptional regulator GlxA family with amidase domain
LLKTSHEPIKRIAETVGFGREERMRRTFQKHLATSPNGYRNQTDAPEPLDRRQSSRVGIALEWLAQ